MKLEWMTSLIMMNGGGTQRTRWPSGFLEIMSSNVHTQALVQMVNQNKLYDYAIEQEASLFNTNRASIVMTNKWIFFCSMSFEFCPNGTRESSNINRSNGSSSF